MRAEAKELVSWISLSYWVGKFTVALNDYW